MTHLWICFIIQCRMGMLLCRCLFLESILPNIAAHNQTLIWSTVWKNVLRFSYKNMQWPSQLEALRHGLNDCFWNITGLRVMGGRIGDIVPLVSTITNRCCFPFMRVIYRTIESVSFVLSSLRPWLILHATSFSITLCISTDLSLKLIRHTIYTCTRPVQIVCHRTPYCNRRPPWSLFGFVKT